MNKNFNNFGDNDSFSQPQHGESGPQEMFQRRDFSGPRQEANPRKSGADNQMNPWNDSRPSFPGSNPGQDQGMRSSDQSREMPRGGPSDQSSASGDNWGNQSRKNNFGPGGSRDRFEESRDEDEFSNWRRRDDRNRRDNDRSRRDEERPGRDDDRSRRNDDEGYGSRRSTEVVKSAGDRRMERELGATLVKNPFDPSNRIGRPK